ncbi:hypothetical protein ACIP5Y_24710 [Nocardia sp. NPDC088792]|uniref:hypothetical protein n=1 Tax=Nocardia sp. NPDC088792 TaxID=3364332 RepID=UPI003828732C
MPALDLQFAARNLPAGTNGYLDIYLTRADTRAPLTKTTIIANNSNPDWPGTYRFWVNSGEQIRLDAEVQNDRGSQQPATLLGTVTFDLASLLDDPSQHCKLDPNPNGNAVVIVRSVSSR